MAVGTGHITGMTLYTVLLAATIATLTVAWVRSVGEARKGAYWKPRMFATVTLTATAIPSFAMPVATLQLLGFLACAVLVAASPTLPRRVQDAPPHTFGS